MCGAGNGRAGHMYKSCENVSRVKPLVIHCSIQQEVLCRKYLNPSCVIEPVSTVNFVSPRGLDRHSFPEFLSEIEAEYFDLPYYSAIQWFVSGKMFL